MVGKSHVLSVLPPLLPDREVTDYLMMKVSGRNVICSSVVGIL